MTESALSFGRNFSYWLRGILCTCIHVVHVHIKVKFRRCGDWLNGGFATLSLQCLFNGDRVSGDRLSKSNMRINKYVVASVASSKEQELIIFQMNVYSTTVSYTPSTPLQILRFQ